MRGSRYPSNKSQLDRVADNLESVIQTCLRPKRHVLTCLNAANQAPSLDALLDRERLERKPGRYFGGHGAAARTASASCRTAASVFVSAARAIRS
jgi:hypothetical protein